MDLKYLFSLLLGGFFLWGCASNSPTRETPPPVEKKSSPPQVSPPKERKNAFNYQKYVEKHQLEERAKAQEKEKIQYKKMLESMALELKGKWQENQQKAQVYYNKALSFHYQLDLEQARKTLQQALKIHPTYKEAQNLQKRILFLLGERRALITEVLSILQEERKLFDSERIPYFKELFYRGKEFQKEGKDREALEIFELVVKRCRFAKTHHLLSEQGIKEYLKWESFLANLLKREKKL